LFTLKGNSVFDFNMIRTFFARCTWRWLVGHVCCSGIRYSFLSDSILGDERFYYDYNTVDPFGFSEVRPLDR